MFHLYIFVSIAIFICYLLILFIFDRLKPIPSLPDGTRKTYFHETVPLGRVVPVQFHSYILNLPHHLVCHLFVLLVLLTLLVCQLNSNYYLL